MVVATVPTPRLDSEVASFLDRHGAQSTVDKIGVLVRECFPELLDLELRLQDDPDVEDRNSCIIRTKLPALGSEPERLLRWRRYHERLAQDLSFNERQLFGTMIRYHAE
ncbi:MAG: hypothetical protein ACLQIB_13220 [Isosphaeraceae bacterium]